jgi:hypothetical protein
MSRVVHYSDDRVKRFPIDLDAFFLATARLLVFDGARAEVNLLASVVPELSLHEFDNWDGGQYAWRFDFSIPVQAFGGLTKDDREAIGSRIRDAMNKVFSGYDNHSVAVVTIVMTVPEATPDWRRQAKRWADGEGASNQGRVRSTNIAPIEHEGLLFRSHAEIHLYNAFKALGVTVAPLPVFVRGGENYQRLEPDFVLVHKGTMMVVEVDGDTFHTESPIEAHERLAVLSREGVHTERVRAADCATRAKAEVCAKALLDILERRVAMR